MTLLANNQFCLMIKSSVSKYFFIVFYSKIRKCNYYSDPLKIYINTCIPLTGSVYSLDIIFRSIEARGADWRSAMEVAKAYCDVSQPETLRNASKNLISLCETKLKEISDESEKVISEVSVQ